MSEPEATILVVDDDPDAHFFLGRKLLKAEIRSRIISCSDGTDAVAYFNKCLSGQEPWPGIVFLDVKMPVMNGFEVLDFLRAREALGRTMVAMFSTSDDPRDVQTAFSRGAHTYLNKDVPVETLGPIIRAALKLATRKTPADTS